MTYTCFLLTLDECSGIWADPRRGWTLPQTLQETVHAGNAWAPELRPYFWCSLRAREWRRLPRSNREGTSVDPGGSPHLSAWCQRFVLVNVSETFAVPGDGSVPDSMLIVLACVVCSLPGCEQLNSCLDCLASEYPSVKFCRIDAVASGAAERFSPEVSKLLNTQQFIEECHYKTWLK